MGPGDKGQVVRLDLVGHIAVARNPVTAHRHQTHVTLTHKQTRGPVNDHGARHVQTLQFPDGQSGSLEPGAYLI